MERIPIYTDIENLVEIYGMDRTDPVFVGLNEMLSSNSELILNGIEEELINDPSFQMLAREFATGGFEISYRDCLCDCITPPFKSNLQEKLPKTSSLFFSSDNERIRSFRPNNGLLMAGIGEEHQVYKDLNLNQKNLKGTRKLVPNDTLKGYDDLKKYILPFTEIIINEPYLFVPETRGASLEGYIEYNLKPLFQSLFENVENKVNVVICTFVNEHKESEFDYFNHKESPVLKPLYEHCKKLLSEHLDKSKFKLWLVASPISRLKRHDRYILTNYQYIEAGSGFALFNERGKFNYKGEAIRIETILEDETRKSLIPSVLKNLQEGVINPVKQNHPNRIFAPEEKSKFLNF